MNATGFMQKYGDLKSRLLFTLGILVVYRIGTYIPLPGINPGVLNEFARQNLGGILGMFDMFSGGALSRVTIFALNLMPYISASIIVQLFTVISPQLEALKKEGESGKRQLNKYTRYLTVIIAGMQGYGISLGWMNYDMGGVKAVYLGSSFLLISVPSLIGGTLFLMWLGEQITARGIGNGTSLIIFSGIVANLPQSVMKTFDLGRTGSLSVLTILLILGLVFAVILLVVFIERAQRRVAIHYPKAMAGPQKGASAVQHLPLKINSSGVIPPIFASSILLLPATVIGFSAGRGPDWMQSIAVYLQHGHPVYMAMYITFILFFSFFYTAVIFDPKETADNLRKHGGFVPGIRPGSQTADHFEYILTRLTVVGAIYLAFLCTLPEILIDKFALPFYFGGTSILIVVSTTIDSVTQVKSYMLTHQYQGLLRKANRGKK